MTNIAKQFYDWRKSRGTYSQRELANDLLVSRATAERWCSGSGKMSPIAVRRAEMAIAAWKAADAARFETKPKRIRVK